VLIKTVFAKDVENEPLTGLQDGCFLYKYEG